MAGRSPALDLSVAKVLRVDRSTMKRWRWDGTGPPVTWLGCRVLTDRPVQPAEHVVLVVLRGVGHTIHGFSLSWSSRCRRS